ncbi:MAG: N-formylglutamate amidohydrolase [Gammaproteobacteria bacterium]|nr:N-formylglutamate amidohydrolase [Gammaproteobacteria bacterium]MDH3769064.1 N-formylglutamate amidohydrolase [Gammaproteobacteria bacterium]
MTPYHEVLPRGEPIPIIVSIPHNGTELPESVAERFASPAMLELPMTDWHLHRLYDFLPELGIATIHARFSRLVVDLNRSPDGQALYPGRFETALVATETFDGKRIFKEPPDPQTIEALRLEYHEPYHKRLSELLHATIDRCGRVILIDAHSVASRANRVHPALLHDIYLGDRDGSSCGPWLTTTVHDEFVATGMQVQRNDPYKGGYTTYHYGQWPNVDALQIEMCQRLYMDEDQPEAFVEESWELMKKSLVTVFATLAQQQVLS